MEVAISRQEGVIEPTFENGQTLPVMSSFSSKTNAFKNFFWGVGSTFSTGEAAFTMSYLYGEDTPTKSDVIPYERVTLTDDPVPKLPFGIKVNYLRPGDVKPVIFGTDTILGFKIKWSGKTAQYPSSVNLGFKRKETALAPVSIGLKPIKDSDNTNNALNKLKEVDIPSLLATIDSNVSISGTNQRLSHLQYFATGSAANNLARQYAVRETMIKRADPSQNQNLQKKKAEEGKMLRDANRKLLGQIIDRFNGADQTKKNNILYKAIELGLVDDTVESETFLKKLGDYSDDGRPVITSGLAELASLASNQ
jgi:hypothetical protein